jgi:aspartyl-tRNA(Asn)/glutamyl-tRNA(Gln) amidotransferase subunit A
MAKTIDDVEIVYNVIAGKDNKDGTSIDTDTYKEKEIKNKPTIGVPRHFLKGDGINKEVLNLFLKTQSLQNYGKSYLVKQQ